jgi:LmbE family N-acetylglucosaminyl deacetylase
MSQEPEEFKQERAMVIFAHPDDAEFGSAGTVGVWADEGVEVAYVVATDGSKGSDDLEMSSERLTETRYLEQRAAADLLGVKHVEFLGFPDGMLEASIDLRRAITAAIRRYRPDTVIVQNPVRNFELSAFVQHPDHLACGEAALAAIYPCARDRLTFPELMKEGLEPHGVREVLIVGTPSPDYWVDISSTIDKKVAALKAHHSQVGTRPVEEFVPNRAKTVAEGHDMEYAEAYRRLKL